MRLNKFNTEQISAWVCNTSQAYIEHGSGGRAFPADIMGQDGYFPSYAFK